MKVFSGELKWGLNTRGPLRGKQMLRSDENQRSSVEQRGMYDKQEMKG